MPKEVFWNEELNEPVVSVVWHGGCSCGENFISLNSVKFEAVEIDRLIRTLRKARKKTAT